MPLFWPSGEIMFRAVVAGGILLSISLFTDGATAASFPEVVGKYACTARDSRFVPGELGSDPSPYGGRGDTYYIEIGPVTVTDLVSAGCSNAASFVARMLQTPTPPEDTVWLEAPTMKSVTGPAGAKSGFGWRCLSFLKMDRRSFESATLREYRAFDTLGWDAGSYEDKLGRIFFNEEDGTGSFLMRSDLSFVMEDMSWNGGIDVEKGTCSRFAK